MTNKQTLITISMTVTLSTMLTLLICYPASKNEARKAIEYVLRCEQLLITGNLEPMCAGYLEYIGYDVETQAMIYSKSPYNPSVAKEKSLAQLGKVKEKP